MQLEERIRRLLQAGAILGDRVRLAVMLYLSIRGVARFKEIAEGIGLSPGNLAHHLRALEEAGYVSIEKSWHDMRARNVRITERGTAALAEFLAALTDSTEDK